ncbi:MAG: hypothetical protein GEU99_01385 [Luteitalea sp.]|nr:hypothetical protein [Luteitalea sp.]
MCVPRLVSETTLGKTAKVIDTYELEPTTSRLVVQVQMEGGRAGRSASLRRVYESAVEPQ